MQKGAGNMSSTAPQKIQIQTSGKAAPVSAVAAAATPSVVTITVRGERAEGSGSGVILKEDGYIVTNAHVATLDTGQGKNLNHTVTLSDGRILDAEFIGADPYADLAVLKIDATNLPAVKIADSNKLQVGDLTVAIGAPLDLPNTVTSGVISALYRGISVGGAIAPEQEQQENKSSPWDFYFDSPRLRGQLQQTQTRITLPVVQTDASINPGNSGGALLNEKGELIAINVAIASNSHDQSTAGSVGLGFAIPSNLVKRVGESLIKGETPSHGQLGVSILDSQQAEKKEKVAYSGGVIAKVIENSAAAKAGLKNGDTITKINNIKAIDSTSVSGLVRMYPAGTEITITAIRDGKEKEFKVTLDALKS